MRTLIGKSIGGLLGLSLLLLTACGPEYNDLAPPLSKLDGISGKWTISKVEQTELTKRVSGFDIRVDVSSVVIGSTAMEITFNTSPNTYSVNSGTTTHNLGEMGDWAFDDDEFPTRITFTPSGESPIVADLKQTVRPVDSELMIEFARACEGQDAQYGFVYEFTRSVN